MKLKAMLSPQSSQALHKAGIAAANRKAQAHNRYIRKCLRSSNPVEVVWAKRQTGQLTKDTPFTRLKVE